MVEWEEVALVYGGEHIGKGVQRLLVEADKAMPAGLMGIPVSKIVNLVAGFGTPVVLKYLWSPKAPWDTVALLIGGYLSTSVWDYAEQAMMYTPVPKSGGGGGSQGFWPGVYAPTAAAPSPPITKTKYVVTG